jgi:DNA-directed RNA polymerase subunit L
MLIKKNEIYNIKNICNLYIMEKISKIDVKVLNYESELGDSRLELQLKGDNIDYIIINSIRRTILSDIPIYAFNEFKFDKNTSIFHNNYLKLRYKYMPVWGIENTLDFLDNKDTINNNDAITTNIDDEFDDDIDLNVDKNINSSSLKQLTMYLTFKNKTMDIITVSTSDAKYYYKESQIDNPYKNPIPLVKLQPHQEISFSAVTQIGIEQTDAMFSAVSIAVYKQINDNEFDFILESRGQITEKRILIVALINLINRLNNFIKVLFENKKHDIDLPNNTQTVINNDILEGMIMVNNEDHTLGNLIARGLQKHKKIEFASYNLPHPLDKKVIFHYKLNSGNIKSVMKDVVDYYNELFTKIKDDISKLKI